MSDSGTSTGDKADHREQSVQQLIDDVRGELGQMDIVVEELEAIEDDVEDRSATLRERAAASAFLASFYMGVENVLKRIARHHDIDPPRSERWHVALFERFCPPADGSLPVLFEGELIPKMDAYRRFRHVIHHGYERDLDYDRMRPGIEGARQTFERFQDEVESYLESLI
jgi:hypothetical protein